MPEHCSWKRAQCTHHIRSLVELWAQMPATAAAAAAAAVAASWPTTTTTAATTTAATATTATTTAAILRPQMLEWASSWLDRECSRPVFAAHESKESP